MVGLVGLLTPWSMLMLPAGPAAFLTKAAYVVVAAALVVTVGTGIGGGIIVDGRLLRGSGGFAGEIGHINVVPGGLRCGCGLAGCWEAYSSGTALVRFARALAGGRTPGAARGGTTNPGRHSPPPSAKPPHRVRSAGRGAGPRAPTMVAETATMKAMRDP